MRLRIVVCTLLALPGSAEILKVLPFAGADSIRIEVALDASENSPVRAEIVHLPEGALLWKGDIGDGRAPFTIRNLKPRLWNLQDRQLYRLTVSTPKSRRAVRFGFRSFETRDGVFLLNGRRIFLRGNAINPPGRRMGDSVAGDKSFAEAYIRDLQKRHVNLIRLGSDDNQAWLDACDELGMLVFQGRYGAPRGGTRTQPPGDLESAVTRYKEDYFEKHLQHPSVAINILTNEMPYRGDEGEAYNKFLDAAYQRLKQWDPNRLYIDNAGFGRGRTGDINDWHPYSGWYGGDFLSFYRLRDIPEKVQPQTLTETVGSYTQADGTFEIRDKQLAAALSWNGTSGSPEYGADYQAFLTKQVVESFRRMRAANPRLAGVMPFTHIFRFWEGVRRFDEMIPKPVAVQMALSYQPVLVSLEFWTTQVYAGTRISARAHIVNDDDGGSDLSPGTLECDIADERGRVVAKSQTASPAVPYYQTRAVPIEMTVPSELPTGAYFLRCRLMRSRDLVSSSSTDLFIAGRDWVRRSGAEIDVVDASGKTAAALRRLGFLVSPKSRALIVGEGAWDKAQQQRIESMVRSGKRVVVLAQSAEQLPTDICGVKLKSVNSPGMWVNPERRHHPVFEGLSRERLRMWSDPAGWWEDRPGTPDVHPVSVGFAFTNADDLKRVAILADYRRGLETVAMAELFEGKGSLLLCGFDVVTHAGLDPAADRMLANLVDYANSPEPHHALPLIDSPIQWSDYVSERGAVGGPLQGLLVNVGYKKMSHPKTAGLSAEIAVPHGRRPFGPFSYNAQCHIIDGKPESNTGSGIVHIRIPPGRTNVLTVVENPQAEPASLMVEVNGRSGEMQRIAAQQQTTIKTPIPDGATELSIRYTGTKSLILLQTAFTAP